MARVTRGITTHAKHKKLLLTTKGYRMTKNRLVKVAKEASLHAGEYAFAGRKLRKRNMRQLWTTRINGQLQKLDLSYSRFINGLKRSNIQLDRKTLAHLAVHEPEVFKAIAEHVHSRAN